MTQKPKGNKQLVASEAFQQCAVSTQTCHLDISAQEDERGTVHGAATYQPALWRQALAFFVPAGKQ